MKKMFSNSMVPAKPKPGKAPSVTDTPQQKVGAPVPNKGAHKPAANSSAPEKKHR